MHRLAARCKPPGDGGANGFGDWCRGVRVEGSFT